MTEPAAAPAPVACRLTVTGTVQGVGFRPFVWRLATELGLDGSVRNLGGRVEIDAYGPPSTVDLLAARLHTEAPARARVESVTVTGLAGAGRGAGFVIAESVADGDDRDRLFPPDLATCEACRRELFDPADRRFRYPFISCTDCGPRATIIDDLPYDRSRTTMAEFALCPACRAEYLDPADRRYHAEPLACAACGPTLTWQPTPGAGPVARAEAALAEAIAVIAAGGIVAVKGLGGFHFAVDATDGAAVARLRAGKARSAKPLAVMVADLDAARRLVGLSAGAEEALSSPAHPIVLVGHPASGPLAPAVSAGAATLGLLLPYTGLHHLLLAGLARPIVLTSGNRSDEPIAIDDAQARARLTGIADGFLGHDRRIRSRYEDSVVAALGDAAVVIRRGRGLAPAPLALPVPTPEPVLAVGAQLKHTFCLAVGARAHLSSHTGDLEDLDTLDAYQGNLAHLRQLLRADPAWVAHDLHPGYLSTLQAVAAHPPARRIPVQHHHAHIASCLAEHGLAGPVVGVALDGLGLGDDGTFWGGEVLVADLVGYRRVARFGRAPMPGGAAAIRQPWRMAIGYLFGGEGVAAAPRCDPSSYLQRFDPRAVTAIRTQIARGINAPVASSAGRLFDAASSLLGLRDVVTYEGEAAIALEHAADPAERGQLTYHLHDVDGLVVYDPGPTLAELLAAVTAGEPVPVLAARFQRTVACVVTALASQAARVAGLDTVCLSGGVFQNAWLRREVAYRLSDEGLLPRHQERVPAGDGGISFGQAAVAAARLSRWESGDLQEGGSRCA